jgi:hypothetical protein
LLENLSKEVRQCYENAEECTGLARATQDERLRADYLLLAQSWLKLAWSHEHWLRLKLFTNEAARRKNDLNQKIRQSTAEALDARTQRGQWWLPG